MPDKPNDLIQRFQISEFKPETIDDTTRSVEVIGATESPSDVWDPARYDVVKESLLMSGCMIPEGGKVPLTIEHERNASSVIGSFTNMRIEGDKLVGRAVFSSTEDAKPYFTKVREGHLNRFSITYPAASRDSEFIEPGETRSINGRSYSGPLLITKSWQPKSLGLVLYAADDRATARSMPSPPSIQEETPTMDKRIRAYLERHGLSPEATDEEAIKFFDTLDRSAAEPPAKAEPQDVVKSKTDADTERAAVIRAERERVVEITRMAEKFSLQDMAKDLIDSGMSLDACRHAIMDKLMTNPPNTPSHRPATIVADSWDKFRSAAEDGMLIRSGIVVAQPAPGSRDLAGKTLVEIARESLRLSNRPDNGGKLEMVGRALTSSDFPNLLANVAHKSLFAGWDSAEETWSQWCGTGSVPDFKTQYLPRISETSDLDEIPEGMEYKYDKRTEAQESFTIATYGKLLAITRQAIINDDLMALTDVPRAHGESAARKVGDLPYAVLTANANMGDGAALFSTTHANYVASGSGAIPGVATIAAGILAMGIQKDLLGKRRLNIRPAFFLGPKALEGAAEVFFRTDRFSDANTVATDSSFASTRVNPYSGTVLTRIYDARLDDDDTAAWYLAASKNRTVNVYFLDGQQRPYMETRQGWNVDGVEYKVRIDAGAKAVDWKGLYYNDGN